MNHFRYDVDKCGCKIHLEYDDCRTEKVFAVY